MNVVLHRKNLHQVTGLLELAAALGAEKVELANTQYYGWAMRNRNALLPSREALQQAEEEVARFRERAGTAMEIVWVIPDYYAEFPKPCMNGWGRMFLTIAPDGTALPCPAASVIPHLDPPSVRDRSIRWIWDESPAFNRFRGFDWMSDPCRSCPRRFEDFGGCRCQAYLIAGDPAVTDPVCIYSPHRHLVTEAITTATRHAGATPVYRTNAGRQA
jgi:pyrroloquinoline quinone biosynthesis protein E